MEENKLPQLGIIDATATKTQALAAIRVILVSLGLLAAVLGFMARGDLVGLISYLQRDEGLTGLITLVGLISFVWGQIKTRRNHEARVILTSLPTTPNSIGLVSGDLPAPIAAKVDAATEEVLAALPVSMEKHHEASGFSIPISAARPQR